MIIEANFDDQNSQDWNKISVKQIWFAAQGIAKQSDFKRLVSIFIQLEKWGEFKG